MIAMAQRVSTQRGRALPELFREYRAFAESIAGRYRARLPRSFLSEDVSAAARAGLWDAVRKYGDRPQSEFRTLAGLRIRGAIVDECRTHDWLPRHARGGFAESFRQVYVDGLEGLERFREYSKTPDPEAEIDQRRRMAVLDEAVARLPPRKRDVMRALLAGREQVVVARQLGVTQARVSQIAAEAVRELKEGLRGT